MSIRCIAIDDEPPALQLVTSHIRKTSSGTCGILRQPLWMLWTF
ncbi:MAG: hypothetical protein R2751_11570 [Bacteroidales bacterium]